MSRLPNLMCIWCYEEDISSAVLRRMKIYLNKYFNCVRIFSNRQELMAYLAEKPIVKHIVFIVSHPDEKKTVSIERFLKESSYFQGLYQIKFEHHTSSPLANVVSMSDLIQKSLDSIISDLQEKKVIHCHKTTSMEKIDDVLDDLLPLFHTFKSVSAQKSLCDLDTDSKKFLLFQSLIEVLIRKPYESKDLEHMWNLCVRDYMENPTEATKIRKVGENYSPDKAIYHYTQSSCLFRLINRAFRLEDIERIFRFGCYIADLHHQLEGLCNRQSLDENQNIKTFYRGKRYSTDIVQQFKDSIDHFISINGFLSTSESYNVSTIFSGLEMNDNDHHSVIFEINIDCTTINLIRPYANIAEISAYSEESEVLFSMGFVWKLQSMTQLWSNTWYIELYSCSDYDPQLIQYIDESRQNYPYLTIGNILLEIGDHANANNFYQRMLKSDTVSDETRGHVYYNMALLFEDRGEYLEAQDYLQKAEKLLKRTEKQTDKTLGQTRNLLVYSTVPAQIHILNNMGRLYLKDAEYTLAQNHFEAALQQPGFAIDRATVLNNYGLFEFQRGNNEKARNYMSQAVHLAENDACCSEFIRNLSIISKHCPLTNVETDL